MDSLRGYLFNMILMIPAILIGFTVHEYAHAVVADRLGDKTPRFQGRLTLNPFVHIDIMGFLMILIVHFGWAKPVQTNPSAFKHYYKDDLKVSIAGVMANITTAVVFAIILGIFYRFETGMALNASMSEVMFIIEIVLQEIIAINCMLSIFNLIPIPGLDGFHILRDLFPKFFYQIADSLYRYQFIILIVFVFPLGTTSIAQIIVGGPSDALTNLLVNMAHTIGL